MRMRSRSYPAASTSRAIWASSLKPIPLPVKISRRHRSKDVGSRNKPRVFRRSMASCRRIGGRWTSFPFLATSSKCLPLERCESSTLSRLTWLLDKPCALCEIAAFVFAPGTKQLAHALDAQADPACRSRAAPSAFCFSSVTPIASITPSSTFREFTLITYCPRGMPSSSITSAAIMHISASAAGEAAPTVSASNCMNWRKRPGPGFSLRKTQPKR